jgi:hypothetical protein
MKRTTLAVLVGLALTALSACERNPDQRAAPAGGGPSGGASAPQQSNTPSTPANSGTPSAAEKKSGSNPTQGQVDPKEGAQQKDFQQRGDGAGPKPGG